MGWLAGWSFRRKITLDAPSAALTDFPAYVPLTAAIGIADSEVRDDGFDIRFTDSDGTTLLDFERENYSESGGYALGNFWVKVPGINAAVDIYIYWGKTDAEDASNPHAVWDAGFEAVWHMGSLLDSTDNGNDLTASGTPDLVAGLVGNCYDFVAASVEYLSRAAAVITAAPCVISAWCKPDNTATQYALAGCSASGSPDRILTQIDGSAAGDPVNALTRQGATWGIAVKNGFTTNWNHVVGRWITSTSRFVYLNGAASDEQTTDLTPASLNRTAIGVMLIAGSPYYYFDGLIDEVRISNVDRSAAWIAYEYHNIADADNGQTWGEKEAAAGGGGNKAGRLINSMRLKSLVRGGLVA